MHILSKWIPLYHCKKRGKGWQRSHLKHSNFPKKTKLLNSEHLPSPTTHRPQQFSSCIFPHGNLAILGHGNILDVLIQRCCWVRLEITPRSSSTKSILICRRWPKVHHKDWRIHKDFWKPTILISWDFPSIIEPSIIEPSHWDFLNFSLETDLPTIWLATFFQVLPP